MRTKEGGNPLFRVTNGPDIRIGRGSSGAATANLRVYAAMQRYRRGRTMPPCDWYLPFLSL